MNVKAHLCALSFLAATLAASQGTLSRDAQLIDGRYLRAFEVAAKHIEASKGMPKRWRNRENYVVAFEGEDKGCYVIHFFPKSDPPKVPATDFNKETGFPLRIYIRKADLKYIDGYVE